MENQEANQLPEVDSLPDGFVEGPTESLAPNTRTLEQEKPPPPPPPTPHDSYRESLVELGSNSDASLEKSQKPRTFPVPLSDSDAYVESETSKLEAVDLKHPALGIEVKGENERERRGQQTVREDQNSESRKDTSSHDIAHFSEPKKPVPQEVPDTKRKNAKRSLKSDKEFLEFTLKYQQVLAERDAAIAVRDKLESLCRELQRQNKMLMDECKRVSTEGQSLRLDLSSKFQDAMKEVGHKLEEQKDECLSQLKENEMLRNKLKQLADQYALSEQQYGQKLKQTTLELQLSDLRIKQYEEKLIQEQAQMKVYAEQVAQLLATEKSLRSQLTADGEKFQQFQDALLKSNEVFETFKQETEKMAKSIKELKKENLFLKSKCEKSDFTLIELVEERERMKKQLEKTKKQKEKLESLCRSLQAERKQGTVISNVSDTDSVTVG